MYHFLTNALPSLKKKRQKKIHQPPIQYKYRPTVNVTKIQSLEKKRNKQSCMLDAASRHKFKLQTSTQGEYVFKSKVEVICSPTSAQNVLTVC